MYVPVQERSALLALVHQRWLWLPAWCTTIHPATERAAALLAAVHTADLPSSVSLRHRLGISHGDNACGGAKSY